MSHSFHQSDINSPQTRLKCWLLRIRQDSGLGQGLNSLIFCNIINYSRIYHTESFSLLTTHDQFLTTGALLKIYANKPFCNHLKGLCLLTPPLALLGFMNDCNQCNEWLPTAYSATSTLLCMYTREKFTLPQPADEAMVRLSSLQTGTKCASRYLEHVN